MYLALMEDQPEDALERISASSRPAVSWRRSAFMAALSAGGFSLVTFLASHDGVKTAEFGGIFLLGQIVLITGQAILRRDRPR